MVGGCNVDMSCHSEDVSHNSSVEVPRELQTSEFRGNECSFAMLEGNIFMVGSGSGEAPQALEAY